MCFQNLPIEFDAGATPGSRRGDPYAYQTRDLIDRRWRSSWPATATSRTSTSTQSPGWPVRCRSTPSSTSSRARCSRPTRSPRSFAATRSSSRAATPRRHVHLQPGVRRLRRCPLRCLVAGHGDGLRHRGAPDGRGPAQHPARRSTSRSTTRCICICWPGPTTPRSSSSGRTRRCGRRRRRPRRATAPSTASRRWPT